MAPQGDKSSYTSKQRRQAGHIERSVKGRGGSPERAKRIAYATVNRQDKGGKRSGSGRGRSRSTAPSRRGGRKGGARGGARSRGGRPARTRASSRGRPSRGGSRRTARSRGRGR
jgi:hypothetical protein